MSSKCQRKICPHMSFRRKKTNKWYVLFCQADKCKGPYHLRVVANSLKVYERMDSRHSLNVQSLRAPPRQTTDMSRLIRPSLGKMVYFHCIKHATARWPQHLSLVLFLLLEAYSNKKVAYQRHAEVMGLI